MKHIEIVKEKFHQRIERNSLYSLRAFARDCAINPGTLSHFLQGKRQLSEKDIGKLIASLKLDAQEQADFFGSLKLANTNLSTLVKIDGELHSVLDDIENTHKRYVENWEHRAILSLMEIHTYRYEEFELIATRLKMEIDRAKNAIEDLLALGMLRLSEEGSLILATDPTYTTNDIASSTIVNSHKAILDLAKQRIEQLDISEREFQAFTLKTSKKRMAEAKKLIREFTKNIAAFLEDCENEEDLEVFQMNCQFFPLSQRASLEDSEALKQ